MTADLTLVNKLIEDGELYAAIHVFDDMILEGLVRRRADIVKTKERLLAMILVTDYTILTNGKFGALKFIKRTNSLLIRRKHKRVRIAVAFLFFFCGLIVGSGSYSEFFDGLLNLFPTYIEEALQYVRTR